VAQPVCAAPARHEEPRRASTEALNLARDGTSRLRDRRSSYVSGGTLVWASATTPLAFVTSRAAAEGPFSFSSRRCDTTLAPARGGRTHLDARHPGTSRGCYGSWVRACLPVGGGRSGWAKPVRASHVSCHFSSSSVVPVEVQHGSAPCRGGVRTGCGPLPI